VAPLPTLETERLRLRDWRESDLEPFAAMNADPVVMRHFPSVQTREQSDASVRRCQKIPETYPFGVFAAETKADGRFIGFIGLAIPRFEAHFTPCVEIGWRLRADVWGQGLATEGAKRVLELGFGAANLTQIVAMTTLENIASQRVMQKIGMVHDPKEDFDHPELAEGHRLRRHVLYRLTRERWLRLLSK
jgi:RimJ/RimL family protein N-acetyltransferase